MFDLPKRTMRCCLVLLLAGCSLAHASTVSVGALSRDTGSTTFFDSLNNREWLSWDLTAGYSYQQLVTALGVGGLFQGFSIANNVDAQSLVSAIFPSAGCTVTGSASCGVASSDLESVVGVNDDKQGPALFLSDNGIGEELGWLVVSPNGDPAFSDVYKANEVMAVSSLPSASVPRIGWALYRTPTVNFVPEPNTFALLGLGLAAIAFLCLRRSGRVQSNSAKT